MKIKRTLSILLSIVLLLNMAIPAFAAEIDPSAQISPRIDPERQKTETFSYIVKRSPSNGGNTLINVDITVTGTYSQVDGFAEIYKVSVSIGGPYASNWKYNSGCNGETARVTLMEDGLIRVQFEFELHTNGNISDDYVLMHNIQNTIVVIAQ